MKAELLESRFAQRHGNLRRSGLLREVDVRGSRGGGHDSPHLLRRAIELVEIVAEQFHDDLTACARDDLIDPHPQKRGHREGHAWKCRTTWRMCSFTSSSEVLRRGRNST